MLHFFTSCRFSRFVIALLCAIILTTSLLYSVPAAHAANISSPRYFQGPPIQCLDVTGSNVTNISTVYVPSPPGGGVKYDLFLYVYVNNNCPNNYLVTNISISGEAGITCIGGAQPPQVPPVVFNGPYGLYRGGGYGNGYTLIDTCTRFQNGVPIASVTPNRITQTITAQGVTVNGAERQDVTSNTFSILVWS